jgi:hypothetical protein
MNGVNRRYGNNCGFVNINYNSFSPLMDKNIACYKCNYVGHKARDCRYMNEDVPMPTTVWRRKEIPNNEDCRIALTAEKCKEEDEWYIDSGCSYWGSRHSLAGRERVAMLHLEMTHLPKYLEKV